MVKLNPKYYPPLKPYAEAAREVLKVMPELSGIETSVPADIATQVQQVLFGLGTDNKEFALRCFQNDFLRVTRRGQFVL
ncbi:hypothetical protein D3C75_1128430 [compost metagenome]